VRTFTQPVFRTTSVATDDFIGPAAKYAKMYDSDILRSFGIKIHGLRSAQRAPRFELLTCSQVAEA